MNDAAAQQISILKRLTQAAAAWLVGMTPRALRDRFDVPRDASGRYDARGLLAWHAGRLAQYGTADVRPGVKLEPGEKLWLTLGDRCVYVEVLNALPCGPAKSVVAFRLPGESSD